MSHSFLSWQRHLDTRAPLSPAYCKFDRTDARNFLRTWIAASTHEDIQTGVWNRNIEEFVGFPVDIYRAIAELEHTHRLGIRKAAEHIFLPVNSEQKLDVSLPIEVLMAIIEQAASDDLFNQDEYYSADVLTKIARAIEYFLQWLILPEATKLFPAYVLSFCLTTIGKHDALKKQYQRVVCSNRKRLIDTWNNQHAPIAPRSSLKSKVLLS